MPRKFTRTSALEEGRAGHARTYEPPERRRLSPRNRLLYVYLGLFAFVLMLLVYQVFATFIGFGAGTVVQSAGVVTAKEPVTTASGKTALRIEVETRLPDGRPVRGDVVVTESHGAGLHIGDKVGILYRRLGDGIRLEQVGAVALPEATE